MHGRVRGYTDGILEDLGGRTGTVADELQSFAQLLATSGDLRGALGNSSVPVASRRAVVQELLAKRASAPTTQLLSFAVQAGAAADYVQDASGVAEAAAAKRDGKILLEEPMGRRAAAERLEGYAAAVLATVKHSHLGDLEDALFRFMRIVEGNDPLRTALTTGELPVAVRQGIVRDLLAHRSNTQVARLAEYPIAIGRPRDYLGLIDAAVQYVAAEADRRVADVRAAVPMSEAERARLAAALTAVTGNPVEVRVTPQSELLGGFVATVGDIVVDASLRRRLDRAREALLAPARSIAAGGPGGPAPQS